DFGVHDEAWFCKAECRHPKTAEDFVRSNSKFTSKITEFCHELKKMVMKRKERESSKTLNEKEKLLEGENSEESFEDVKKIAVVEENKPLLEVEKGVLQEAEQNNRGG
ncbi:hypothetical protein IFM89_000221, partial [Coptis chinensis]